jgi:serine/threonine protein kinase
MTLTAPVMDNELIHGTRPPRTRYLRREGDEPLRGYRLVSPLGIGGFGEVWKCLAPGGLLKAIKIVPLSTGMLDESTQNPARLEEEAIERIKEVRHPFLISIDRVDRTSSEFIVVMELAETSLAQEFEHARQLGQAGIAPEVLLRQLREAAEVLDVMNFQHRLQHFDIKPANLLISAGHVKLADFGLVNTFDLPEPDQPTPFRCFTPRYAAPELLQGSVSRSCDQYSLAVVYQEMLTGQLPYDGNSLLKRLLKKPNLEGLPPCDQLVVERALSSKPEDRFRSCLEFVDALLMASGLGRATSAPARSASVDDASASPAPAGGETIVAGLADWNWVGAIPFDDPTRPRSVDPETLTPCGRALRTRTDINLDQTPDVGIPPGNGPGIIYPPTIHVSDMRWKPDPDGELAPPVDDFIASLCRAATGRAFVASSAQSSPILELPGQTLEHTFHMPSASTLALRQRFDKIVAECRGEVINRSERSVVFAIEEAVPFWKLFNSRQRILRVSIRVEGTGREASELARVHVRIEPLSRDGPALDAGLLNIRPLILRQARAVLQVAPERRLSERFPCSFEMRLYPVISEWKFDEPVVATAVNLSSSGIGFTSDADLSSDRVYLRPSIPASLGEYAILTDIVRRQRLPDGVMSYGAILGRI